MSFLKKILSNFEHYKSNNAFCVNDTVYTYDELYSRVRKIAFAISQNDGGNTIGIVTTNAIDTYASIFACWFLGKAYVPVNPKLPSDRNKTILQDAGVSTLLSAEAGINDVLKSEDYTIIYTSDLTDNDCSFSDIVHEDDTLMYVLFTSGSTGVPKGVPINYKNLSAFITSFDAIGFDIKAEDKFLQMFEFTFDVSIASFLVPVLHGACVYPVSGDGIKYINVLKILRDKQITFATLVPSIITYLKPYFDRIELPQVKYCVLTAEASNLPDILTWQKCVPNAAIYNLYGPTEATVWCTAYKIDEANAKSYQEMVIIGKPLKEVHAIIVNEKLELTAVNEKGQLCVSGKQVTVGYLNNAAKNAESFFTHDGEVFYKTGDLCYFDEDGEIYYCGRIDHQVKINGHRIELSEIDVVAKKLLQVNSLAVSFKDKDGIEKICLFLEGYDKTTTVNDTLKDSLPYYMLPHIVKNINSFPINNSNKVDRQALKSLI